MTQASPLGAVPGVDCATAGATADVGALIDARPISMLQGLVAVLCGVAMLAAGYDLQALALAVPTLSRQWHLPASQFGLALSAATVGLAVSAIFLAPLGDRFGRKPTLIIAMTLVGAAALCTITSADPAQFVWWRVLTGLGMGIGIPNCNAWTAEYAPLRRRALILVLMNAAVGAGAFAAAIAAPKVIAAWGWHGTFIVGGTLPLLLACALFAAPESVKFLAARRPADPRIPAILRRIAPGAVYAPAAAVHAPAVAGTGSAPAAAAQAPRSTTAAGQAAGAPAPSVLTLLAPAFRTRTLLLWLVTVLNLFILFLLLNWLPTLLQSAGLSADAALQGTALIQAGGVAGGIALSFWIDRAKTLPALRAGFIMAAVCLGSFTLLPAGPLWNVLLLLIGAGIGGAQLGLNALSTAYYPPAIKATGMSWVGAIGQAGSIVAPLAGAWIIARGVPAVSILALLCVPAVLCAAVVFFMRQQWQAH